MTMQRVQLDISSDIFDNVFNQSSPKVEQKLIFGDFLNHTQKVDTITKFTRDELHER